MFVILSKMLDFEQNIGDFKQTISDFEQSAWCFRANWMRFRANYMRFRAFWAKLCERVSECVCVCVCVWVGCVCEWVSLWVSDTLVWVAVCTLLSRCVLVLEYRYWKLWEEDDKKCDWKTFQKMKEEQQRLKKRFYNCLRESKNRSAD